MDTKPTAVRKALSEEDSTDTFVVPTHETKFPIQPKPLDKRVSSFSCRARRESKGLVRKVEESPPEK